MLNRLYSIPLLLLALVFSANSKDIPSDFFITGGGDLNGINYHSDFKSFEGVENCCTRFTSAYGLSYNFHAGLEYHSTLFGMTSAYDLSFAYSNLSAEYKQDYPFANIITGNTYTKAVSEYILKPKIQSIIVEPGIYITPIPSFPISFRLGLQAGMLMGKTFEQQENLLSPANAFFENGTKTRGVYSGAIPKASSIYLGVSVGARFKAAKFGNFTLFPELRFNYGLSQLVQGLNWKVNTLQAGVMIAYNIPGTSTPPPAAPPMPALPDVPQPPAPSYVKVNLDVDINDQKQENGAVYTIPYKEYITMLNYSLLPVIFFKENSAEQNKDNEETGNNIGEARVHSNLIKAIATLMKSKPELKVNIISSSINSEEEGIVDSRINSVTEELQYYGIGINKMNISKKTVKKEDFKEIQLIDENIFVRLELSDGTKLIPYSESTLVKREYPELTLNVKPEIITTSDIKIFRGEVIGYDTIGFDIKGISTSINDRARFQIRGDRNNLNLYSDLTIRADAENQDGTKASETFDLRFNTACTDTISTLNPLGNNESKTSQFILCYFDYDRSEPKIINENVAALVRKAISDGKKVTFLAQTDNLGTENYNSDLAIKRGRKAMELFNGNSGKITVTQPNYYIFSNLTPLGRMLNRTVVVRIEE